MAKYIDRSLYRNPPPPSEDYDYEITDIEDRPIFYIFPGVPSRYLNFLYNIFPESFGSGNESSVSSLTSDDEVVEVPAPPKIKNIIEETIFDSEEDIPKDKSPEKKQSPKKKSPPKRPVHKGVVRYSDTESSDSEPEPPRRYRKSKSDKHSSVSESERRRHRNSKSEKPNSETEHRRRRKDKSGSESEFEHRRRRKEDKSGSESEFEYRRRRHLKGEKSGSDSEFEYRRRNSKSEGISDEESRKRYFDKAEDPVEKKKHEGVTYGLNTYSCDICSITLTSEITLNNHLRGKRHIKQLNALNVAQTAKNSLISNLLKKEEPKNTAKKSAKQSEESLYPKPEIGVERAIVDEIAHIQKVVDAYRECPMAGLERVIEIRYLNKRDVTFYCSLCNSPCSMNSIMNHLIGFKHRLRCFEEIYPDKYDEYRYQSKKVIERKVDNYLGDYERRYGRGRIQVEAEFYIDPPISRGPQPGPSWMSQPGPSRIAAPGPQDKDAVAGHEDPDYHEDLDMSQNDFRCIVCDSHMNNKSMWEAHIRGKRHLKNKNKSPGEIVSKVKSVFCPDEEALIMATLNCVEEPIVGLDHVNETQGENGNTYNCFLCGACMTDYDVTEHLLSMKHRIKFLESANNKGMSNPIESIKKMHDISNFSKEGLIEDACLNHLHQYGNGRVKVYKVKSANPIPAKFLSR